MYINKGSMATILDFTMAAKFIKLKMCSVHLLTSKIKIIMFRHLNHISIIFRS